MITSITSTWFECQVSVPKTQDNGTTKVVNEVYTVDALTFTEAETANVYANEMLGKGMQDYRIISNVETRIMDVFQH